MARKARALRAERLLGNLDDDVLSFLQQLFDFGFGLSLLPILVLVSPLPFTLALQPGLTVLVSALELVEIADDVGDVQEPVSLQADLDEGGLHAGQHLGHPALVDIADHAAIALALNEDLRELVVLEDGHAGFVAVGRNDHFLVHGGVSS